jgi:hypothetical protein
VESISLGASVILADGDSWDGCGAAPQIRFGPVVAGLLWLKEHNVGINESLAMSHKQCEFADAGSGARALRMRKHQQRRSTGMALNGAGGRPLNHRRSSSTRRVFVVQKNDQSGRH